MPGAGKSDDGMERWRGRVDEKLDGIHKENKRFNKQFEEHSKEDTTRFEAIQVQLNKNGKLQARWGGALIVLIPLVVMLAQKLMDWVGLK